MSRNEPLFSISGVIDGGKLHLPSRFLLDRWMASLKSPTEVIIEFYKLSQRRTDRANAFWESLVRRYALHVGESFIDARTLFKLRHGVSYLINRSFDPRTAENRHGVIINHGGEFVYLVSTADYSKEEFAILLDGTIRDCVEAGVSVEELL